MNLHNPDRLSDEQIGISDGWRLLEEGERPHIAKLGLVQYWDRRTEVWFDGICDSGSFTYRTRLTPAELRKARGVIEPSDSLPWNHDAPDGLCWKCPDCESWATLGGNAAYHAKTSGHGKPQLCPQPERKGDEPCQSSIDTQSTVSAKTASNAAAESDPRAAAGMKTAEELFKLWCGNSYSWDALTDIEHQRWIRFAEKENARAFDAYRAGLTKAAEIAGKANWCSARMAVLSHRDNLKELP